MDWIIWDDHHAIPASAAHGYCPEGAIVQVSSKLSSGVRVRGVTPLSDPKVTKNERFRLPLSDLTDTKSDRFFDHLSSNQTKGSRHSISDGLNHVVD